MRDTLNIPLAIVGMGCRLPGANNIDEFWELVRDGKCAIDELPADRLNRELYYDPRKGELAKTYTTLGGIVPTRNIDASQWHLSPRDMQRADDTHLELCAVASDALQHAGMDPLNLKNRRAGVYVGHTRGGAPSGRMAYSTQIEHTAELLRKVPGFSEAVRNRDADVIQEIVDITHRECPQRDVHGRPAGNAFDASRLVSDAFQLDGPYFSIDAACASSLMATMMGIQALQLGEIDMALVGGASRCEYDSLVLFSKAQSVSGTGSRPFDANADGLIAAEGYVILVMKRLDQAIADGDAICAVLRGLGVSSDGRGKSLWAPRREGQIEAVRRAYSHPNDIQGLQFIEAHATSTQVGDATEVSALAEALEGHLKPGHKVPLGSVKANIGHTLEVAGIAGLLKTVLAIQHQTIPAVVGVDEPNPKIDWEQAPFCLPKQSEPWPAQPNGQPRRAAVNAFGIGGLNTHVVVDEYVPEFHAAAAKPTSVSSTPTPRNQQPIAVIGASAILPNALNLDAYWQLLESRTRGTSEVPADRWNKALAHSDQPGPWRTTSVTGGFIHDFEYDWRKHKVPPKQVAKADPLQFMLLEAVDQAISDAGMHERGFDRMRTGVIVGTCFEGEFSTQLQAGIHLPEFRQTMSNVLRQRGVPQETVESIADQYADILLEALPALSDETGSFTPSTLASRITKTFDLMGGAASLDCGEASALGALDTCVQMLSSGRCDTMICASGQRGLGLFHFERFSLEGTLSRDGERLPYEQGCDGEIMAEGVGVVILKRLDDAIRDGDPIRAVLRSVGNAKAESLQDSVTQAVQRSHASGNIEPDDVQMIVSAANGREALDQAELEGLAQALPGSNRQRPALLTTATSQIGNAKGASGMVSLLKAVLTMNRGTLTESTRHHPLSPWVANKSQSLSLITDTQPLPEHVVAGVDSHDGERLAYHVTLEYPPRKPTPSDTPGPVANQNADVAHSNDTPLGAAIIRLGGKTLQDVVELASQAAGNPTAFFPSAGEPFRPEHHFRLAMVAASPEDLAKKAKLAAAQAQRAEARDGLMDRGIFFGQTSDRTPKVAFMFPGQASQYPDMLRALVEHYRPAATALQQIEASLKSFGYPSFAKIAWEGSEELGAGIFETQLAVLVADCIMYASVRSLGIEPDRVSGHSFGEISALVAAGSWGFRQAAQATYARCRAIIDTVSPDCTMMSTTAPWDEAHALCEGNARVFVANHNAPDQVVLAGYRDALEEVAAQFQQRNYKTRMLTVPSPFHCPLMESVQAPLARDLAHIPVAPPNIPVLSSVTNRYVAEPDEIRNNLVEQMTKPVRYVALVERLAQDGIDLLIEVGPNQVLTRLNRQIVGADKPLCISSDTKRQGGLERLLHVKACLEAHGVLPRQQQDPAAFQLPMGAPTVNEAFPAAATTADGPTTAAIDRGRVQGAAAHASIRARLRRLADHAGHEQHDRTLVTDQIERFEAALTAEETAELKGVAEGAAVPYPSILAFAVQALIDTPSEPPPLQLLREPRPSLLDAISPPNDAAKSSAMPSGNQPESCLSVAEYCATPREETDPAKTICRRFVPRMLPQELASEAKAQPLSGDAIIYGSGPLVASLEQELKSRGVQATVVRPASSAEDAIASLQATTTKATRHLFVLPPASSAGQESTVAAFFAVQTWLEHARQAGIHEQSTLVAISSLGGDFGFSHRVTTPASGALTGLIKGLFIEEGQVNQQDGFRAIAVDFDETLAADQIAETICREVTTRTPEIEVGYVNGHRHVVRAIRQSVAKSPNESDLHGGQWIITGGARGVTALVARELARRFDWTLHVLGTSPAPEVPDAWRDLTEAQTKELKTKTLREARAQGQAPLPAWNRVEKAIEIDKNLQAYRDAGVTVHYHPCDLSDRAATASVLDNVRRLGPICGILHGAGFEKSCRFKSKKPELVERTFSAKVGGAAALIELTHNDPLRYFVAFGSTSGRLGSHGQTDYCAANDMLAKQVDQLRSERPQCRSAVFHWHAWDEVGMAVRPEIAGVLKAFGLKFMPSREGIDFLAKDLLGGLPESEVLITEWSQYRRMCPQSVDEADRLRNASTPATPTTEPNSVQQLPLIDDVATLEPNERVTAITRYDPTADPFLKQHTLRKKPVLPLVSSLEAFAEAGWLLTGSRVREFRNLQIQSGMRFFSDRPQAAESRLVRSNGVVDCELACDFVNQRGVTMKRGKSYMRASIVVGEPSFPPGLTKPADPPKWEAVNYPDDESVIYHGPIFRCLKSAFGKKEEGVCRVVAPDTLREFGGNRQGDNWMSSPALLDACLFAAGGHLWVYHNHAVGLPESLDRLVIGRLPKPSEECRLQLWFHGESDDHGRFDMCLFGDNGDIIYYLEGYHNVVIPGTQTA